MNKISNFLKTFAVKNWQKYSYKKEWASVILLLIILKIATSAISIFSGYFYLNNFFFGFTNSDLASRIFTLISLFLIEGLCALFLAKFFKFALRADLKTALLPLFCTVIIFAISFVISCNGIALFTTQSEDLSKEINSKYNFQISELKKETSENIQRIENYIETIKKNPEIWSGGKCCLLSDKQNKEIAKNFDLISEYKRELNKSLKDVENQRKNELLENDKQTTDKSDKYYKIVAFIMFIQVCCSGGLWFFWSKIAIQDAPENDYKESISDIYKKAENLIDSGLNLCFNQKFSVISTAFAQLQNDLKVKEIAAQKAEIKTPEPKKITGFSVPETLNETQKNDKENAEKTTQKNAFTLGVSDVQSVNLTPSNAVFCAECGKELTLSQITRKAKFCCPSCRVKNYNKTHPEKKKINISESNLKH